MLRRIVAVGVAAIVAAALTGFLVTRAVAGIGPAGFAYYARQGILREINAVYGAGNNPYVVTCTEVPDYRNITDTVTCKIREK